MPTSGEAGALGRGVVSVWVRYRFAFLWGEQLLSKWIAERELFEAHARCLFVPGNTVNLVARIEWVECVPEWAVKRVFGLNLRLFMGAWSHFLTPEESTAEYPDLWIELGK